MLRVPKQGSLGDLNDAHQSALDRIQHGKPLNNVLKPRVFEYIFYDLKNDFLAVRMLSSTSGTTTGHAIATRKSGLSTWREWSGTWRLL